MLDGLFDGGARNEGTTRHDSTLLSFLGGGIECRTQTHEEDRYHGNPGPACIGCGACVASCKNSSAMLYVSAKVSQFALLPQGQVEAKDRVLNMVNKMDEEGFGNCTNTGACEVQCPTTHMMIQLEAAKASL